MTSSEVLHRINAIFATVRGEDNIIILKMDTKADVDAWDSLDHMQLVSAIERHYGIKFTTEEIRSWTTVGDICESTLKEVGHR